VISFKSEAFELISSLNDSQVMMDFIRDADYEPSVKGLLMLNQPDCLGEIISSIAGCRNTLIMKAA